MAAEGTTTFTASLEAKPDAEMKTDTKKWIYADPKIKKIFAKKITHKEKIDLNPAKWNDGKLKKAMEVLVRTDLQLLATRVSDLKKASEKAKSPKEHNKIMADLQKAYDSAVSDIAEKCADALDDLASGKGEAKAGIALGKKAMAQVEKLKSDDMIKGPLLVALTSLKNWMGPKEKGDDAKADAVLSNAQKDVDAAVADLANTGKQAQNVAKFLLATGKKMKNHENGQLANFGKKIMKDDVQPELAKLDSDLDKLESALGKYADVLKKGTLEMKDAKTFDAIFKKMLPMQKTADKAVSAMKSLQADFKKIEKELK